MSEVLIAPARDSSGAVIPVHLLTEVAATAYLERAPAFVRTCAELQAFKGKAGQVLAVSAADGHIDRVLAGLGGADKPDAMVLRALPAKLPAGDYRFDGPPPQGLEPLQAVIAFGLGSYRFDRYKPAPDAPRPRLVCPQGVDLAQALTVVHACALARDMVNTPANDMGPLQIETIAREVAERFGGRIEVVAGDALLDENYPAIHAVGRSATAARAPRMIELTWSSDVRSKFGGQDLPLVALVGKGVVFDTGGLDIKPSSGMRTMKKDMGGAAHALALGRMVMAANLPVRLVVLLPVAENAISAESMRPGDVLATRKGLTVEVGNTDAEGRLILADALTRAAELKPDLTIDMATLTGAARVALGPQVVPFYTADDGLAADLAAQSEALSDPLWRMPLWAPYAEAVDSDIADLKNDPDAWAQAGSITAALFLQRFAPQAGEGAGPWIHLDIFAWNGRGQPGRPAGGEAQAVRALMGLLAKRYG